MRIAIVIAFAALSACTSQAQQAEERYEIVKKSGKATDVCIQGQAVVAAYLKARNAQRYAERQVETEIECASAQDDERRGIYKMLDGSKLKIEADNFDSFVEPTAVSDATRR